MGAILKGASVNYKFEVGETVMWRGGWGSHAPKPAKIIGTGDKNEQPVYDLDNGHWAYEDQLEPCEREVFGVPV